MIKNEGFTLVELLAVIVILAVIVLIAVPQIMKIIKDSRLKALDLDAKTIQKAAARKLVENPDYDFSIIDADNIEQELNVSNIEEFDSIGITNNDGNISVTLTNGDMSGTSDEAKIYGLQWDGNNNYVRLDDAVGLIAAVGTDIENPKNDFDNAEIFGDMHDVEVDGNMFVKIPLFYIKKEKDVNTWTWRVSKKKYDKDYYLPAVFKDYNTGKLRPYVLVGKYNASLNGNKLESQSGVLPLVSASITSFRTYAKNSDYQLIDIHTIDLLQTLFTIEFATVNSDIIMRGNTETSEAKENGETDNVKSSSGSIINNLNGEYSMKYRGIENLYGNVWQWIDGINIQNHKAYVSTNASGYKSNKFDEDYRETSYINATANNYVVTIGFDKDYPYVNLPITVGALGNSPYQNYYYQDTGEKVARFGGSWSTGVNAGLNTWALTSTSGNLYTYTSSRLVKTPNN